MTRELRPCRVCGRAPKLVPYEQSIDGNHDRPARVECMCGSRHVLTLGEFYEARTRVPPGERGLGYLSAAEIEAINDRAAEAWNDEQAD